MINLNLDIQSGKDGRQSERGNVLFLILIAVALFAALSYAVTQSTRSGGGDASRETNLVNSAQITQYPAALKTSIVRMMVSSGTAPLALVFNPASVAIPSTQAANTAVFLAGSTGGGATYQLAPRAVLGSGTQPSGITPGQWVFNAENQIANIGTTNGTGAPNAGSADVIAFLPNVTLALCEEIHRQLGLSTTIPTETSIDFTTLMETGLGSATQRSTLGGNTIDQAPLSGQPQGCFQQPANTYIYYQVLVER